MDALQSSSIFEHGMLLVCGEVRRAGEGQISRRMSLVLEGNAAAAAKPAALIPRQVSKLMRFGVLSTLRRYEPQRGSSEGHGILARAYCGEEYESSLAKTAPASTGCVYNS